MRKLTNLTLLFIFIITLFSCEREPGDWKDNIKLSTKAVEFNALADSVTVTTGGGWWLAYISVNNVNMNELNGINGRSDNFIINHDWFVIERQNKNTLFIKVAENQNIEPRILTVGLQNGDYWDRVTITQKAMQ